MATKSPQELSADTQFLLQRLRDAVEGEIIPYYELSALVRRDVQKAAKCNLESARVIARREYGFVFVCIPNQGVKRLANEEIPVVSNASRLKKIKGQVNNWQKELSCADYDRLSKARQSEYNLGVTLVGTMGVMTSAKPIDELRRVAANSSTGALSLSTTLDIFKST